MRLCDSVCAIVWDVRGMGRVRVLVVVPRQVARACDCVCTAPIRALFDTKARSWTLRFATGWHDDVERQVRSLRWLALPLFGHAGGYRSWHQTARPVVVERWLAAPSSVAVAT